MKNVPENELFSAYLDGELTAAEQADVEQLLAASPAARQLLEELRALSATLQSLPVYKLTEDLSPQVLRQAERRILGGPTVAVGSGLNEAEPVALSLERERPTPVWRMIAGRLARPRTWIWPAAAVAVAILLAVFLPERRERVAHQPPEKAAASAAVSNVEVSREMLAEKPTAAAGEENAAFERMKKDEAGPTRQPGIMPAATALTTPAPAASPVMVAKRADTVPGLPGGPREGKPEEKKVDKFAEAPSRPMKSAKEGPAGAVQTVEEGLDVAKAPEEIWIVTCDVTADAIRERLLDQVLAKRRLVRTELARKDAEQLDRAAAWYAYAAPRAMKAKDRSRAGGEGESDGKAGGDAGKLVYVHAEATSADLQAVLADLKARPQMVASVSGATATLVPEPFQAGRRELSTKAIPPIKQAGKEADQRRSGYARDLKGAQQAPADSQPTQFKIGAQEDAGMSQAGRGAVRSQATLEYGSLGGQQAAIAEQAFGAGQQLSPPVRLNIVGPLPADQTAPQLAVKRRVLFVLRVVDAGGIAAGKVQASKAAAARVESAESKPGQMEAAKAAQPAASAPPPKPAQDARK